MKEYKTAHYKKIAQLGPYVKPENIQPQSPQDPIERTTTPDNTNLNNFFNEVAQTTVLPGSGEGLYYLAIDAQNPENTSIEYDDPDSPSFVPHDQWKYDDSEGKTNVGIANYKIRNVPIWDKARMSGQVSKALFFMIPPSTIKTIKETLFPNNFDISTKEVIKELFILNKGDESLKQLKSNIISNLPRKEVQVDDWGDVIMGDVTVPENFTWSNSFQVLYYNY